MMFPSRVSEVRSWGSIILAHNNYYYDNIILSDLNCLLGQQTRPLSRQCTLAKMELPHRL